MNIGAKIQSSIEVLQEIINNTQKPADNILSNFFKSKKYIGSSDRREIGNLVYDVIRQYISLVKVIKDENPRNLILGHLLLEKEYSIEELNDFSNNKYSFKPINDAEIKFFKVLLSKQNKSSDFYQKDILPNWMYNYVEDKELIKNLHKSPSFDVRINPLKTDYKNVIKELKKQDIDFETMQYSKIGIRFNKRQPLHTNFLWQDGLLEVQDEGSQLASFLCLVKEKHQVLDACAGAGGKSLVFAAMMQNTGKLVLSDISKHRLDKAKIRLRRAGISNYTIKHPIDDANWFKRQNNTFDRVVIDSPCSGSGTFRRNPDLKNKLTKLDLLEILHTQEELLEKYKSFVSPGGLLIYITCSVFEAENKAQITKFLNNNSDFEIFDYKNLNHSDDYTSAKQYFDLDFNNYDTQYGLFINPTIFDTDGFFICALLKK